MFATLSGVCALSVAQKSVYTPFTGVWNYQMSSSLCQTQPGWMILW